MPRDVFSPEYALADTHISSESQAGDAVAFGCDGSVHFQETEC